VALGWVELAILLVFGTSGLVLFCLFALQPAWASLGARFWTQTPCLIQECALVIEEHPDSDNASGDDRIYGIRVRYTFQAPVPTTTATSGALRTRTGHRHGLADTWRVDRPWLQAAVDTHPKGSWSSCWINPRDPSQAVLDRSLPPGFWRCAWLLIAPLVGYGIPLGIWQVGKRRRRPDRAASDPSPEYFVTCSDAGTPQAVYRVRRCQGLAEVWKPAGWEESPDFMRCYYTTGFDGNTEAMSERAATKAILVIGKRVAQPPSS
jgi:hypothetical protein